MHAKKHSQLIQRKGINTAWCGNGIDSCNQPNIPVPSNLMHPHFPHQLVNIFIKMQISIPTIYVNELIFICNIEVLAFSIVNITDK
jgi:hypothetical protein